MQRPVSKTLLPKLVIVAVVYYAAVRLGLEMVLHAQLWTAAGIALAAVLRWGPAMLLAIVPAHLLAHRAAGSLPSFSAAAATAAALEAVSAAWLLGRLRFDHGFATLRDVAAFVAVGVIAAPGIGALFGTAGLAASGQAATRDLPDTLRLWWLANGVGVLVLTPILLLAGRFRSSLDAKSRAVEAALVTAALLLVCLAVFGPWPGLGAASQPISFAVFPVVAWAAYRLGPAGAAGANLLVAAVAVWGTLGGSGPFAREPREDAVFFTWVFLAVTSVASLALAALAAARDRTEHRLRDAYDALETMETATLAGSWIWRPDVRLHLGSARQRELLGVAEHANPIPEEVLLDRIHPDDRRRVVREFTAAWESRGRIEMEYRIELPDGSLRWLAASGACVPADPARPKGRLQMVGVHVDVTARKRMEAVVRRGERLASLGTFAAGVAHELNNPLGTILLAAETARASSHDRESVDRALDEIADDAQRAARIVRSVLRFAKEEPTERTLLDLRESLRRAADLTRSYCRERGVGLEVWFAPRPLEVLANATEIVQMVQNLVRNAAEACGPGGSVRLEADGDGKQVVVSVADDGRGMTPGEIEHAFDPFYTTRSREGGSGLGLSICHGIAEAHDGRIELESAPGRGTCVRVRLPAIERDARGAIGAVDGSPARG